MQVEPSTRSRAAARAGTRLAVHAGPAVRQAPVTRELLAGKYGKLPGESRDRTPRERGAVVTLELVLRALPCEDIKIGGYAYWWADLRVLRSAGEGGHASA